MVSHDANSRTYTKRKENYSIFGIFENECHTVRTTGQTQ